MSCRPLLILLLASAAGCAVTPLAGVEKKPHAAELDALKAIGAKVSGVIVWSSTRTGSPDLFTMKTDGSGLKALTDGEAVDWHPRFSPDGSKILFVRSKADEWVRERDGSAPDVWDIYTVKLDGTDLTRIVEDGTWASWSGPDEIVFVRGQKILRTKVESGEEHKVMDAARFPVFDGAVLQQPELSHDGRFLALTLAGAHRQTGIWDIKKKTWTQAGGGELAGWGPDDASIYWVNPTGNGLSEIVRRPIQGGKPAKAETADQLLMVDLPGKRSHEGFPRLSPDGKWLVFGAANHVVEHDLTDYELYLWEVGSDAETAARLTFHSGTDSWPDIFTGAVAPAETKPAEEAPPPTGDEAPAGGAAPAARAREEENAEPEQKADPGEAERKADTGTTTDEAAAEDEAPKTKVKAPVAKKKKKRR